MQLRLEPLFAQPRGHGMHMSPKCCDPVGQIEIVAAWGLPISVFKSTRSRLNVTTVALVVAARVSLASATFPAESGPALSNVGVLKQAVATF